MTTLLCIGFGYCAQHYAADFATPFDRIIGTTRSLERAEALAGMTFGQRRVEMLIFDGRTASRPIIAALREADALLVSAAPADGIDPVLALLADEILQTPRLSTVVLLSTLSVYGDHGGAVVSETTPPEPVTARGRARLDAERAWETLGARRALPVACLRLAGIYGTGQNALVSLARGTARRIRKPGQVFNRVHVGDIAQAIDAAFAQRASGVFNITDDEPSPPGDPIAFAAALLQMPAPPEIDFAEAAKTMTPMALSFYRESKRVDNARMKHVLGVRLRYPTYREGLCALHAASRDQAASG
jgi:nucleoside-diphosphate-sugar epimerase